MYNSKQNSRKRFRTRNADLINNVLPTSTIATTIKTIYISLTLNLLLLHLKNVLFNTRQYINVKLEGEVHFISETIDKRNNWSNLKYLNKKSYDHISDILQNYAVNAFVA